jgi:hypothetical protein
MIGAWSCCMPTLVIYILILGQRIVKNCMRVAAITLKSRKPFYTVKLQIKKNVTFPGAIFKNLNVLVDY